jgi:hypothetical protein
VGASDDLLTRPPFLSEHEPTKHTKMKSGKTISELASHVSDLRTRVRDFRIPGSALRMNPADLSLVTDTAKVAADLRIKPNRLMHEQLAERLGIPTRYYQKMMGETPELLARNVNEWLTRGNGEKRFVRTFVETTEDGSVKDERNLVGRAFLGSTYRPLDNFDLMTAIVPPMLGAGVEITSSEVTESRLYIQAVAKHIKSRVVVPGTHNRIDDILNIGIVVSNSEVGNGSLSVRALVFRQVCSNGLVISDDLPGFKQVHIGRADTEDEKYLSTDTKKLRDAATWSRAQDVINAAISQATLDKITDRLNVIAGVTLQNPEKAVELVAEKFDLIEEERAAIMRNLISGGDVSQWGLTNAVTALANDVASYDRAVELETIGGKVAGLSANQFGNN